VTDLATSTHDEAAPTAATLANAPGASDDGAHGCCPERDETRSCATMTGCLLPVALPIQDAPSGTAQVDRVIVAARLGIPAIVSFSPELPPPRA
jgi:hypothetical protein